MSGRRQPTELLIAKGKKHLTQAEIEERLNAEISAPDDRIEPPAYLSSRQKKTFRGIAGELRELKLISNLDCDALARLIIAQEHYIEVTRQLKKTPLMLRKYRATGRTDDDGKPEFEEFEEVNEAHYSLANLQQKFFTECRQGAADFGLTVSSRCRLVIPKAPEAKPNKFIDGFMSSVDGMSDADVWDGEESDGGSSTDDSGEGHISHGGRGDTEEKESTGGAPCDGNGAEGA